MSLAHPLLLALALLTHHSIAQDARSAFQNISLGNLVSINMVHDRQYLDRKVADHLNTASEARSHLAGIVVPGSKVTTKYDCVAANARNSAGKTLATLRVSMRESSYDHFRPNFALLRKRHHQPTSSTSSIALPHWWSSPHFALPNSNQIALYSTKLVSNGNLLCTWSQYEQISFGRGPVIQDGWICPVGKRTIKLTTLYQKALRWIYGPTVEHMWRTLKAAT